jgi:predicted Fe-Mo cluster-binding NifX family protein
MKLAISSTGPDPDSLVDPRFGRCRYYFFYDTESEESSAIENTGSSAH